MSLPISLTSISSRLDILPKTLRSLLTQTLKPTAIHLWLSKEPAGMDDGIKTLPAELASLLATEPLLHLHWTDNTGPYRKLLPFAKLYPDTPVLVVDDDTIHSQELVATAYTLWNQYKCCISFRATRFDGNQHYRLWPNAAGKKEVDIFHKGNGGVVYHTSWFQDPVIHDSAVFLSIAPTADDIWFNLWRMKKGIFCYCYIQSLIQRSISVKTTLFHINEAKNDEYINRVWDFIKNFRSPS
jgi:hypothetical protein